MRVKPGRVFDSLRSWDIRGIMSFGMTENQEEALYDFLDNAVRTFELDEVISHVRAAEGGRAKRLGDELEAFINCGNLAFPAGVKRWTPRRFFFEPLSFVISPTKMELVNGIFIPGHRCVPFAHPDILPHEYSFFWRGSPVPATTTEGPPEEFYPYYSVFGEEYAPQYVARDNPENEEAFNTDPYDDPPEVSVRTLDMRNIFRETSFVPGDRFVVKTRDWKEGVFDLEKVGRDEWAAGDLDEWFMAAESGFEASFARLGPASCTEEQIAYAYWYGDSRMRELPAYALEEYLYEKTNKVETTPYGIETRFWYAGREIPDRKNIDTGNTRPDKTPVEETLCALKIPVSEYVLQSYIRDALYRGEEDEELILERLVPSGVDMNSRDRKMCADFLGNVMDECRKFYSAFLDRSMGPIRQRAGELHTAVIELAARLGKGDIDNSWLPRHTFIILSQIQSHTAGVLEDLDSDEPPGELELEALDNSLDSMIETYEDIKELIDEALDTFRRNKLAVIRPGDSSSLAAERLVQLSVSGVDVWRRIILPETSTLLALHRTIQTIFAWRNAQPFRFAAEETLPEDARIRDLEAGNIVEFLYEYGAKWAVKVMILSRQETVGSKPVRCVAGAGAAPPEFIEGPLKFRRLLAVLESGNVMERSGARQELGPDFVPGEFDVEACNRALAGNVFPWGSGR